MDTPTPFFSFVFDMKDPQSNIMNLLQYAFIAVIPIWILLKIVNIIPEANESKGILETSFEVILQIVILVVGICLINRFVIYFKPMSNVPYPDIQMFSPILILLLVLLSIQSKLNEKIFIIVNKIRPQKPKPQKPASPPNIMSATLTSQMNTLKAQSAPTQTLPDYNEMYKNQPIYPTGQDTLMIPPSPPPQEPFVPMAANEAVASFGSNF